MDAASFQPCFCQGQTQIPVVDLQPNGPGKICDPFLNRNMAGDGRQQHRPLGAAGIGRCDHHRARQLIFQIQRQRPQSLPVGLLKIQNHSGRAKLPGSLRQFPDDPGRIVMAVGACVIQYQYRSRRQLPGKIA